jgi:hypothetical protein
MDFLIQLVEDYVAAGRRATPRSKVETHLTVLQGMSKEPHPRYQPRINVLECFALLHWGILVRN